MKKMPPNIGLVLIGGSLKGIYGHTGVVCALRDFGIKPKAVLGASAGSVVGAFYVTGMSELEMNLRMLTLKAKDFLDPLSKISLLKEFVLHQGRNFKGFVQGDKLEEYIQKSIKGKDDFNLTDVPYYVAATNIKNYEVTLFNNGAISETVRASTAVPLLFCPKKIGTHYYVDGALEVSQEVLHRKFLDLHPELDLLIVSNFNYEQEVEDDSYLDNSTMPMVEIIRRILSIRSTKRSPRKIGDTNIMYIKPGLTTPVDIFKPSESVAASIYEDSYRFAMYHFSKHFPMNKVRPKERGFWNLDLSDRRKPFE